MKLSVSLPDEDVEFLDVYMQRQMIGSRSAAIQRAVQVLRATELVEAYREAFEEWYASEDAELWESTVADGLNDSADASR